MFDRVADVMTRRVYTLPPTATLGEAVLLQMRHAIRHVPIVENGRLVGMVTDRDIKRATPSVLSGATREDYDRVLRETSVTRVMTRDPKAVSPEAPLRDAVALFARFKYGALPVVDDAGRLVGILSQYDAIRLLLAMLDGNDELTAPRPVPPDDRLSPPA